MLRHPLLWWLLAVVFAVGGGASLTAKVNELDQERASWGDTRLVAVVTRPVSAGEAVRGAVEIQELPTAFLSDSVVSSVDDQALARVDLFPGELLRRERLSETDIGQPVGTAALTVTLAQVSLVEVGDLVDLWAVDAANEHSKRVASRAVVLDHSDRVLTIAVPHGDVGAVALAAVRPLTVAVVG